MPISIYLIDDFVSQSNLQDAQMQVELGTAFALPKGDLQFQS
jgi:hypothetical protein